MMRPRALLLDTNVWIAHLLAQEPHARELQQLVEAAIAADVALLYTPSSLKDVFFIIPRALRREAMALGKDHRDRSFTPAAWACVRAITEMGVAATQALPECEMARTFSASPPTKSCSSLSAKKGMGRGRT